MLSNNFSKDSYGLDYKDKSLKSVKETTALLLLSAQPPTAHNY